MHNEKITRASIQNSKFNKFISLQHQQHKKITCYSIFGSHYEKKQT